MRLLLTLRHRLRSLFRSAVTDHELARELDLHLEQLTREFVADGMSEPDARRAARRAFGPALQVEERCRDTRRVGVVADAARDVRFSLRLLRRAPGFALAAVLSIAFGVGANTAMFGLVDAVLLRTLPVERPEELVFFRTVGASDISGAPPYPWFERVRDDTRTFAGMAVFATDEQRIAIDGRAEQVYGQMVSGSFFDVLGVRPAIGRLLTPDDEKMAPPVAVIGYGYWQRRFGGRAYVLGTTIALGSRVYTIVGVTAPTFSGLAPGRRVELTTPLGEDNPIRHQDLSWWSNVVARLRHGATVDQAAASGNTAFQAHMQTVTVDPQVRRRHMDHVDVVPADRGLGQMRDRFATPLQAVMGLALAVLLIGCGNLGMLLLVRGEGRAREMAIRQASGASAGRLLRQMLTETVLLFVFGAAAGLVVAWLTIDILIAFFAAGRQAIQLEARLDWRVASFAAGLTLIAGVLTGIGPAVRTLRISAQEAMRSGDTRLGGSRRARATVRALVVGQVALCLTLVVCALLFATTMRKLRAVDLGFTAGGVLTQSIDPLIVGESEATARQRFWTRVLDRIDELPEIRASSLSVLTPMSGRDVGKLLEGPAMAGRAVPDRMVHMNHVSEDYLAVFGIDVVQGRAFTTADRNARVALISVKTQGDLFPGRSAVGETLDFGDDRRYTIVGVVRDAGHRSLREAPVRMVYLPLWQPVDDNRRVTLSVATLSSPHAVASAVARAVREVEPSVLVSDVFDVEEQIESTIVAERLLAILGTAFASLALGLAALGVYGVLNYAVSERRAELALRMALGARPARVSWDVSRELLWQMACGLALGLVAAWLSSRAVSAMLFGVDPLSLVMYALAVAVLSVVAAGAAAVPLARAASLNPADVFRG